MIKRVSDEEILRGCLKNDRKYQKLLFEYHYSEMMSVCLRYTKDSDEAQDLLQEGFIKVFNKLDSFQNKGKLVSWIKAIMIRNAIDNYRSKQLDLKVFDNDNEQDGRIEAVIESQMEANEILALVQKLPEALRVVFNMHALDGITHREIAAELNINESTSKGYVTRARKALKIMIEELYPSKQQVYAS